MLKQLKNFLLHDIPPDQSEILIHPRGYLKKLLLGDDNRHHHHNRQYSRSSSGYSSFNPTPRASNLPSRSESYELPVDVVDDGHPGGLGNPKILQNIFNYLSSTDLLQCRLVSLRWNVVASSILQRKLGYTKVPPSKLKCFMKLMTSSSSFAIPFDSYAIRINDIREKQTKNFLHFFCLQIKNLRVRLNISELVDFARHLQNMINLRHLHVIVFDDGTRSNNHFIWNSSYQDINVCDENGAWKMGLYAFANLKCLHFENAEPSYQIAPYYDRVVANIIAACGNLQEYKLISWNSPLGRIFTKFDVGKNPGSLDTAGRCATADEIVMLFFNTNLRFHFLKMEVSPHVTFELIADAIHRCGDSLNELTVVNENVFEKFILSSTLRSLVKLRMDQWRGPVQFTHFSKQFPALKLVKLNLSNLFELEQVELSELIELFQPCNTVKTLTMTRLETGAEASLIQKLAWLFPNVKEFFVEVRNGRAVQKIYEVYPQLTLLCVELNRNNLSGGVHDMTRAEIMTNMHFTGVPDEEIKVIQERMCGCPIVEFPEESRSCWNVGCLTNLHTLLLRVPRTVNNITLLEGISRLENLKTLFLLPFYDDEEEPIKWCLRSVADNFPRLQTLVTSTEVDYDEDDVRYLMERIPELAHRRKP